MTHTRRTATSGNLRHTVPSPTYPTTTEPMMRTRQPTTTTLENLRIPVQAKLAAAWTSFMFLCVYVDIIAFFKPGQQPQGVVGFRPLEQLEQSFGLAEFALAPAALAPAEAATAEVASAD